jgi:hypothetical protein
VLRWPPSCDTRPVGFNSGQTAIRVDAIQAPAQAAARQGLVVLLPARAEQRQAEAALALEGAVARAGVAAQVAEQGDDMALEGHLAQCLAIGKEHRDRLGDRRQDPQREDSTTTKMESNGLARSVSQSASLTAEDAEERSPNASGPPLRPLR